MCIYIYTCNTGRWFTAAEFVEFATLDYQIFLQAKCMPSESFVASIQLYYAALFSAHSNSLLQLRVFEIQSVLGCYLAFCITASYQFVSFKPTPDLINSPTIQWGLTVNWQKYITKFVIYNHFLSLAIFTIYLSALQSFIHFSVFPLSLAVSISTTCYHAYIFITRLSSLTVWSCLGCQRSISQTSSTCATSPWGRCTCSRSPSSPVWCCSGSSRPHLLLLSSPWWWVDHLHHQQLSLSPVVFSYLSTEITLFFPFLMCRC